MHCCQFLHLLVIELILQFFLFVLDHARDSLPWLVHRRITFVFERGVHPDEAILGDLLGSILEREVNLEGKQVVFLRIFWDRANACIKQEWFIRARYDFKFVVIFDSQLAFDFFVCLDEVMAKADDKIIDSDLVRIARLES